MRVPKEITYEGTGSKEITYEGTGLKEIMKHDRYFLTWKVLIQNNWGLEEK